MKTIAGPAVLPMRAGGVASWHQGAQLIALWRRRAQERQALAAMGERDLRDIGITSLDAWCEANKPFWLE